MTSRIDIAFPKLDIALIWWRNVQLGEFYNIERYPRIEGSGGSKGGGSLYIEIPGTLVPKTLEFLDTTFESLPVTISARVIGAPSEQGEIEFHPKNQKDKERMRIARQNRKQPNSQRHPAWTAARGFPRAADDVRTSEQALQYFPEGGLRIYIAKTFNGEYFAGFTKGPRPDGMLPTDPMWPLYPDTNVVGDLIRA